MAWRSWDVTRNGKNRAFKAKVSNSPAKIGVKTSGSELTTFL